MKITPKLKDHYVYVHYKGFKPVYVGQGKNHRLWNPLNRNHEWDGYRVLAEGLTKSEANELELLTIHSYGYENLENKKPGQYDGPRFDISKYNRNGTLR